jgi:hypothetical protein
VSSAQGVVTGTNGETTGITFTATAVPTAKAGSNRVNSYVEAKK